MLIKLFLSINELTFNAIKKINKNNFYTHEFLNKNQMRLSFVCQSLVKKRQTVDQVIFIRRVKISKGLPSLSVVFVKKRNPTLTGSTWPPTDITCALGLPLPLELWTQLTSALKKGLDMQPETSVYVYIVHIVHNPLITVRIRRPRLKTSLSKLM